VPPDRVESVSPDGRTIALVRHGAIKRWSPTTGAVRTVRGVRGAAQLEFLGDGSRLLVVTTRGAAVVVGVNGARATRTVGRGVSLAAASRNGRYVATVRGRALTVTRTSDGRRWRRRLRHSPSAVEFDPVNAQILFLAFPSRRPRPFRMRWQRPALIGPRRVAGVDQQAACYVFSDVNPSAISADGRLLAVVDVCGGPRVYDTGSGRLVFSMPADAQPVSSMQFDPSGTRLLTVKRNVATIWALPPEPKEAAITLGGHTDVIDAATFSPDGRLVATASNDGSARVWDAGTGAQLAELRGLGIGGRSSGITAAQFSPDSRLVATVDEDGVARLWNGATPGRRLPLRRYDQVAAAGFAGDSRDVVFVTQAGRVGRWRPGAGRPKPRIKFHGFVFDASVAEDAPRVLIAGAIETSRRGRFRSVAELGDLDRRRFRRIAGGVSLPLSVAAAGDRVLTRDRIWRVAGGKWGPRLLPGREWRNLTFAGFARDGRMLFATNGGRAQIVDSHGHTIVHLRDRNRALSSRIYGGSFDRAGDRVVTWGAREAVIWDAGTGHVLRRLSGHRGVVAGADFSGDGSRVVTAGADRTIRVWDARTGDQLAVLAQVPGQPTSVAFDRSGQDVLAVSANFEGDGTARLIRCLPCRPIGKLIATAEHRVTRALTPAERTTFVRLPRQR
jgi:WD40 repeat protein